MDDDTGRSPTHSTFAQPAPLPRVPAGYNYGLQVEPARFTSYTRSDVLGPAQGSNPSGLASLSRQSHIQPQPGSNGLAATGSGSQLNETMFGLEPLGYSESVSLLPSASQFGAIDHPTQHLVNATMASDGGQHLETGVPDFALVDDTLSMWTPDTPQAFG